MADPRLNSIHLDPSRRQEYRRAREALLNARGSHTLAQEHPADGASGLGSYHTIIQNLDQSPADAVLFWLRDRECIYPLKVGLNTIGRSNDNDVVIEDSYVSRRHCAVLVHSSHGCELHDTASKNGTFLNGQKISGPTPLSSGDEIRMCDCHLHFVSRSEDRPAEHTATQSD